MRCFFTYLIWVLLGSSAIAHSGSFTDQCDELVMPSCNSNWNAATGTDSAVYFAGDNGNIFIRYYYGGTNSILLNASYEFNGIQFINNNIGYVWGSNGALFKTTNAGLNWSQINTDTSSTIDKVQFIDVNNGFFMVDSIIKTTNNGGTTWTELSLPSNINFKDFHFFDALNGQIAGGTSSPTISGSIYSTSNGGANWSLLRSDTIAYTQLNYVSATKGFVYGGNNNDTLLLETNNTGTNWFLKYNSTFWSLKSDVIEYRNQTHFVSNENGTNYLYGAPYFLDTQDGPINGIRNIAKVTFNGQEFIYLLTNVGVYQYANGKMIIKQINFVDNVQADSANNPLNTFKAGGKIRFKIIGRNVTLDSINSAQCVLRCNNPLVTVTDSTCTFGKTYSWFSSTSLDELEIMLDSNIVNESVIHFQFNISSIVPGVDSNTSILSLPVVIQPFAINKVEIVDTTSNSYIANNNGIVEPGETVLLNTIFSNTTKQEFSSVKGELVSPFLEINVWDNWAYPYGSGLVKKKQSYGTFAPYSNGVQPVSKYVFTNNFDSLYKFPLSVVFTGLLLSYADNNNCKYNYYYVNYTLEGSLTINDSAQQVPDSLFAGYTPPGAPTTTVSPNPSTGINDATKPVVNVYPNPSNGVFIVSNVTSPNASISLYNLLGKKINTLTSVINSNTLQIDLTSQPTGVYYLNISSINTQQSFKLVKSN